MHPELVPLGEQARDQKARVAAFLEGVPEKDLLQRPEPGRWSGGEHLTHVALATDGFVASLRRGLEGARAGRRAVGASPRRGPLGRFIVRTMAPPVTRRIPTRKNLVPSLPADREAVAKTFRAAQDEYLATVEAAEGVDLGRPAARFPAMPLLRLRLIQMFELVVVHTERHLWSVDDTVRRLGSDAPRVSEIAVPARTGPEVAPANPSGR